MYSYLHFGIAVFGIFTIIENLRWRKVFGIIQLHFILLLSFMSIASALDFATEMGYDLNYNILTSFTRLINTILIVNLFYLLSNNKVPKIALVTELIIFVLYIFAIINGFRFIHYSKGVYAYIPDAFHIFNILVINTLLIVSMFSNIKVLMNKYNDFGNLYHVRLRRWYIFLVVICLFVVMSSVLGILSFFYIIQFNKVKVILILFRFLTISFILFRPKFIDEMGLVSLKITNFKQKGVISVQNFELHFYMNNYFLNQNASLNDFALLLNHSNSEVSQFLKEQTNDSFIDLVNKNRISYFKEQLKQKQHESFTIEALSEMSGFNNRQSMYNAFRKYEQCSPSEYINNI